MAGDGADGYEDDLEEDYGDGDEDSASGDEGDVVVGPFSTVACSPLSLHVLATYTHDGALVKLTSSPTRPMSLFAHSSAVFTSENLVQHYGDGCRRLL